MAIVENVDYGKRPRLEADNKINCDHCFIFIVPAKFSKARLQLLKDICKTKSLQIAEQFSDAVTHIVTKFETREKVYQYLKRTSASLGMIEIVNDTWLTACITECRLLDVFDKHRIEPHLLCKGLDNIESGSGHLSDEAHKRLKVVNDDITYQDTKYECQRCTPLNHHNQKFTEALEILEKHASYIDRERGESRALAFRKASCALKSYPRELTTLAEVSRLKYIGEHSSRVITEILENGWSEEVQNIVSSEMHQVIELFTGIYGCGPSTAHKWYSLAHRTIQDIKDNAEDLKLNVQQNFGVEYYDDLNASVSLTDAQKIQRLVTDQLDLIQPGCSSEIVGGFSRGKPCGHDVDILITHPEEDKVEGLLVKLVDRLTKLGCMIHTALSVGKNSVQKEILKSKGVQEREKRGTLDNLDKCFVIMKVEKSADDMTSIPCNSWIARRVDLIIAPFSQYAFSLLGWIGSKQFNRSLRLYAWKELNIHLSSHGMWDHKQTPPKRIFAKKEEDIFKALNLHFVERQDRNC